MFQYQKTFHRHNSLGITAIYGPMNGDGGSCFESDISRGLGISKRHLSVWSASLYCRGHLWMLGTQDLVWNMIAHSDERLSTLYRSLTREY